MFSKKKKLMTRVLACKKSYFNHSTGMKDFIDTPYIHFQTIQESRPTRGTVLLGKILVALHPTSVQIFSD